MAKYGYSVPDPHIFAFFLTQEVLSRMNMSYEHWVEKENCYGDPIRAGNTNIVTILENKTGLHLATKVHTSSMRRHFRQFWNVSKLWASYIEN